MTRFRYAVLSKEGAERLRGAAALLGLTRVPVGIGTTMFVSDTSGQWIQTSGGIAVIGKIYSRPAFGNPCHLASLGEADFDFDRFNQRFWGDFLYIQTFEGGCEYFRSPSGRWPVYWGTVDSQMVVASDAEILIGLGVIDGSMAWDQCLRQLAFFEQPHERTALVGMSELLPGFRLRSGSKDRDQASWWDPWAFYQQRVPADASTDAMRLRSTVTACVRAHICDASRLIVRVSGGLDSSIVAASLARRDPRARLMVLVAGDGDGDERHHARLLARGLDLSLIEERYAVTDIDLGTASFPDLPVPRGRHTMQVVRRICDQHFNGTSRGAVLTGFGGDALFAYMMSVRAIVDRLRSEGIWKARHSLMDVARLTDSSIFEVIKKTVQHMSRGRQGYSPGADALFINPQRLHDLPAPAPHPWLSARRSPGKSLHIGMILGTLRHMDHSPATDETSEIAPLMSQPIIEACLAIPTWLSCAGGRDRAIARQAFEYSLPPSITARRSKGGPDAFCTQIFEEHRMELRDRLLGGELARNDVIDRKAVEDAFRTDRPLLPLPTLRLLQLSDAEAWAAARLSLRQANPSSDFACRPSV